MKRLLAIIAFLFGGISVEVAKPLDCSLVESSQPRLKRSTPGRSDEKQ